MSAKHKPVATLALLVVSLCLATSARGQVNPGLRYPNRAIIANEVAAANLACVVRSGQDNLGFGVVNNGGQSVPVGTIFTYTLNFGKGHQRPGSYKLKTALAAGGYQMIRQGLVGSGLVSCN